MGWDAQKAVVMKGSLLSPKTRKGATGCAGAEWLMKIVAEPTKHFPPNHKQSAMQNKRRRCSIEWHQEVPTPVRRKVTNLKRMTTLDQ